MLRVVGSVVHRIFKLLRRTFIPLAILLFLFTAVLDIHTQNFYNNRVVHVEKYTGGRISGLKRIRCHSWFGNCNQIVERSEDGTQGTDTITWYKIGRELSLDGSSYLDHQAWSSHDYLYVTYADTEGDAVVDVALGDPRSLEPPQYVVKELTKSKLGKAKSRFDVSGHYDLNGWTQLKDGIWVKYGPFESPEAITDITYLFGEDVIEPRPQWNLVDGSLSIYPHHPIRLSFARGVRRRELPKLRLSKDKMFKVLQLSDLHFTSGFGVCLDQKDAVDECHADAKSLAFIHRVIDEESPDLVVYTGDLIDGSRTFDYQTAFLKALSPVISRSIPFAIAMGEHDTSVFASRDVIVEFLTTLPFSTMHRQTQEQSIGNITNYVIPVMSDIDDSLAVSALYMLDLFEANSPEPLEKTLHRLYNSLPNKPSMSLEFQHYPIAEYRPRGAFALVGQYNEKTRLKSSRTDKNTRKVLSDIGVQCMSVGSEHTNECCIRSDAQPDQHLKELWMCFGPSVGEGAYGSTAMDRRVRLFKLDSQNNQITTWKRHRDDPSEVFDYQFIQK